MQGLQTTEKKVKRQVADEIRQLATAMVEGLLDQRADLQGFEGRDAELLELVNQMVDTLVAPLRLAVESLDQISHGKLPSFVVDDYKGEYNKIKKSLNSLLATLYGLHAETQDLVDAVHEGRLSVRGNDWDFQGNWQQLIHGVNKTLDAVIQPVHEASGVLSQISACDLRTRMKGKYHGEHAAIKKAVNRTASSLDDAIGQVSNSVVWVAEAAGEISQISQDVAKGAEVQAKELHDLTENINVVSKKAEETRLESMEVQQSAQQTNEAINASQDAMARMVSTMSDMRTSTDNTRSIVQEINEIAKQTDGLSTSAASKAVKVRSSAGGFGVVASEIRKLSVRCKEVMAQITTMVGASGSSKQNQASENASSSEMLKEIMKELDEIVMLSNYLGLNAAIEAAHVEAAGEEFELLTEEVRQLAQKATEAAKRTEQLIQESVQLSHGAEALTKDIGGQLDIAVKQSNAINSLINGMVGNILDVVDMVQEASLTATTIGSITKQNVTNAQKSTEAAGGLQEQTQALTTLVQKFKINGIS
jgi:methyl-accepting chemotaxis protein